MPHGRTGYERDGCRCEVCTAANTRHVTQTRLRRLARLRADENHEGHGTHGGVDAGCRCEVCRLRRQMRYWAGEGRDRRPGWRQYATEIHHLARLAWEARFEQSTGLTYQPGLIQQERRRERRGGRRDVVDFVDSNPAPMFKDVLVDLADEWKDLSNEA